MTQRKIKRKQIYEERKSLGLCVKCGQFPHKIGRVSCEICCVREAKTLNDRREERRRLQVCEDCGKDVFASGLCKKHYDERQLLSKKITNKRLARREAGLCESCGSLPLSNSNRTSFTCETCYLKTTAKLHLGSAKTWRQLKELFVKQSVCPYTGIELVLGVNTSLDHIVPISEGGDNLENLQWVYFEKYGYFDVNRMKGAMSHEGYKAAIKIQYEYLFGKFD
jgi:hypothetical protein